MALWIKTDGTSAAVQPQNGATFTLDELQHYVGGLLEALDLGGGLTMWLNEEGKLDELPYNPVADEVAHRHTAIAFTDGIVGDVLVATREETAGDEEED